jgi:electron transfer flavoprotein alpha subunit
MSVIMVVAEHRQGVLRDVTLEAVGAAVALGRGAGLGVVTVVLGDDPAPIAAPLLGHTPELRLIAHPALRDYDAEPYLAALADVAAALGPGVVLMGHTSQGMDLAPALAGRLGLPLVTDCTAVSIEGGALSLRRQCHGGKIVEELAMRPGPAAVLTLQAGAFGPGPAGLETVTHETRALASLSPRHARRFLGYFAAPAADVDITAADILVSVGRGIGSQENIALAQALADAIGATVSCSRPVADAGWLPQSRQVGTSGKTVRPRLYVALGISGAFQHLAGMRGADTVLAVNKDPRAPIFQVASYGIVGDVIEVLPLLTRQLGR